MYLLIGIFYALDLSPVVIFYSCIYTSDFTLPLIYILYSCTVFWDIVSFGKLEATTNWTIKTLSGSPSKGIYGSFSRFSGSNNLSLLFFCISTFWPPELVVKAYSIRQSSSSNCIHRNCSDMLGSNLEVYPDARFNSLLRQKEWDIWIKSIFMGVSLLYDGTIWLQNNGNSVVCWG